MLRRRESEGRVAREFKYFDIDGFDGIHSASVDATRTHAKRIERLREQGLAELAPRIHAPLGLDLGGRAAAEIAVSVLAQVIQERYRRAP